MKEVCFCIFGISLAITLGGCKKGPSDQKELVKALQCFKII